MKVETLGCLVCGGVLVDIGGGLLRCAEDGFTYPAEVVADTPPGEWQRIRTEKLYCLDCEQVLPGMPTVHADRKGNPIPCAEHKARKVRFWTRWRRRQSAPR